MTFIQHKELVENRKSKNNLAVQCMSNEQWIDAFELLKQEESSIAVLYNLTLCSIQAKEYETAYETLNKAISMMNSIRQNNVIPNYFFELESQSESYLKGLPLESVMNVPKLVLERMNRLLFDLYLLLNQVELAYALGKKLEHHNYKNVTLGMEKIEMERRK